MVLKLLLAYLIFAHSSTNDTLYIKKITVTGIWGGFRYDNRRSTRGRSWTS